MNKVIFSEQKTRLRRKKEDLPGSVAQLIVSSNPVSEI